MPWFSAGGPLQLHRDIRERLGPEAVGNDSKNMIQEIGSDFDHRRIGSVVGLDLHQS